MDVDVVAVDARMSRWCEDGMGQYFIGQGPGQHGRKLAV